MAVLCVPCKRRGCSFFTALPLESRFAAASSPVIRSPSGYLLCERLHLLLVPLTSVECSNLRAIQILKHAHLDPRNNTFTNIDAVVGQHCYHIPWLGVPAKSPKGRTHGVRSANPAFLSIGHRVPFPFVTGCVPLIVPWSFPSVQPHASNFPSGRPLPRNLMVRPLKRYDEPP